MPADVAAVVASLPTAALVVDADGRITAANAALEALFQHPPGALIGAPIERLLPPDARSGHVEARQRSGRLGMRRMLQGRVVWGATADGLRVPLEVGLSDAVPELPQGSVLALVHDVSEREALRAAAAARGDGDANLVAQIVGGLAHQFNNQLASIAGVAEVALADATGSIPHLLAIRSAVERSAALTQELVGIRRRDGPVTPACLAVTLREQEPALRALLAAGVELCVDVVEPRRHVRMGAPDVAQLLTSLVRNAAEAVGPRGRIRIALDVEDHQARLRVIDDGPGIPRDLLPHVTRPFVTTHHDRPGAGLGLTWVAGLVASAGGRLRLEDAPGGGLQVEVRLPFADQGVPSQPCNRPTVGRILVVDDERLVRETLATALSRRGHTVVVASGAEEAIAALEGDGGFDLLITDIVMPHIDGVELATEAQRRFPKLPVLFMSGYSRDVLARHGLDGPPTDLLPKPFTLEAAMRRVDALIGPARGDGAT